MLKIYNGRKTKYNWKNNIITYSIYNRILVLYDNNVIIRHGYSTVFLKIIFFYFYNLSIIYCIILFLYILKIIKSRRIPIPSGDLRLKIQMPSVITWLTDINRNANEGFSLFPYIDIAENSSGIFCFFKKLIFKKYI